MSQGHWTVRTEYCSFCCQDAERELARTLPDYYDANGNLRRDLKTKDEIRALQMLQQLKKENGWPGDREACIVVLDSDGCDISLCRKHVLAMLADLSAQPDPACMSGDKSP